MAISSIFLYVTCMCVMSVQREILYQDAQQEQLIRDQLVLDLLVRDLASASMTETDWHPNASHNYSFLKKSVQSNGDCATETVLWQTAEGGLLRSFGDYDGLTGAYKHTDFFACSIRAIRMYIKNEPNMGVTGVGFEVMSDNSKLEKSHFVRLRNRVLS